MKNKIFLSLSLIATAWQIQPYLLTNSMLKTLDNAGMFDRAIIDILRVRQAIKELAIGKYIWHGATIAFDLFDAAGNKLSSTLEIIINRPGALFGATFIVINPDHAKLFDFVTEAQKTAVQNFVAKTAQRTLLDRYEHPDFTLVATGTFVVNPMTKELIPVFVGDYTLDHYDTRICKAHIAIPAHEAKDFEVAQKNRLPIKLVISAPETDKNSSPQINRATGQLMAPYPGDYSDCIIINSDFLNGSVRAAHEKAITFLKDAKIATEYKEPILYQCMNKVCNINDLQAIETLLTQEHKTLTPAQREMFAILMIQAQSDFLRLVEQFLINARDAKELMIELIEESCKLRNTPNAYLLHWVRLKTNESEKVIFKRDINTFYNLCKFCAELIDFLGDFGSSCTHALDNLRKIQNNR